MEVFYTSRFVREARQMPRHLRPLVEERVELFKLNPHDPRLETHKLRGKLREYWSFSIDYRNRIIFEFITSSRALFHSIGDHSIYD